LTSPSERNDEDIRAAAGFGIATTNVTERALAATGQIKSATIKFLPSEGVDFGGVLFLLPSLLTTGLLSYRSHYQGLKGYYNLDHIITGLSFLYLCRIKNPEQLKHYPPGELGKLIGLDRIPEAKKLREKIYQISQQKQAKAWNRHLAKKWVEEEGNTFYYIDGHVEVYSGHKANLGKKHISRLKLCLPGMTEFWVNNADGLPYFVVTGEVNEKLQEMILTKIVPELIEGVAMKVSDEQLNADKDLPRFTLVFDREAYSPKFFEVLWEQYRVAVITYRKNVKDLWDEKDFTKKIYKKGGRTETMEIAEKNIVLDGVELREVRKKNSDKHQTSIITNNKKIDTKTTAVSMFARWSQENFFKYLRENYDMDRMSYYITNEVDKELTVVNPIHSKLTYKIKKLKEKIDRRKLKLFELISENAQSDIDEDTNKIFNKQSRMKEELQILEAQHQELKQERKQYPYHIKVKDMEEDIRYNKLDLESKLFQNVIKMICYRAETNFALLLSADYKKRFNEMRALVQSLINTKANIIPDYENKTLTIELYSLSNPRDNQAVINILDMLNDSETVFPGTDLKLKYKFATL